MSARRVPSGASKTRPSGKVIAALVRGTDCRIASDGSPASPKFTTAIFCLPLWPRAEARGLRNTRGHPACAPHPRHGIVVHGKAHGSRLTAYGSGLTAHGLRLTAHGSRLTAHGLRLTAHGLRLTAYGSRLTAHGSWLTAHGLRLTAYGSRLTAHGSRLMAYGSRLRAYGSRLTAHGSRLTACGSGLAAHGLRLTARGLRLMAQGYGSWLRAAPGGGLEPSAWNLEPFVGVQPQVAAHADEQHQRHDLRDRVVVEERRLDPGPR